MNEILYKDFIITASPSQSEDDKMWVIKTIIAKERGESFSNKPFYLKKTYPYHTKEEAILHCLDYGKKIIDGKFSDCSVDDL